MPKRKRASATASTNSVLSKRRRISYGITALSASQISSLVARRFAISKRSRIASSYPRKTRNGNKEVTLDQSPSAGRSDQGTATVNSHSITTSLPQSVVAGSSPCQPSATEGLDTTILTSHVPENCNQEPYAYSNDNYDYRYVPIADNQIRLLQIWPGLPEDDIVVKLETVDDITDVAYTALLYVWGDQTQKNDIFIEDEPGSKSTSQARGHLTCSDSKLERCTPQKRALPVGNNLCEALRALRQYDTPTHFWIDAICINQSDHKERNAQVRKMGDIYRHAENVLVRLANKDHDDLMCEVAMETIPDIVDTEKYANMLADDDQIWRWASVLELMNNDWFKRLWVVQEIAFAKRATVQCGTAQVDWNKFRDAIALCSEAFKILKPKLVRHLENLHAEKKHWLLDPDFEIEQLAANRMVDALTSFHKRNDGTLGRTKSLETLVCLFQGFASTDPRDKIFALLSLANDRDLVPPDYSKSTFEVYQQFVQHCVTTSQSLDIICHQWSQASSPDTPLPTWISVDLNHVLQTTTNQNIVRGRRAIDTFVGLPDAKTYAACGTGYLRKAPIVDFPGATIVNGEVIQNSCLHVRGVTVGRISFCTQSMTDCVVPQICFEKLGWTCNAREKCKSRIPDRLCRTLVADRGPSGSRIPPWYHRAAQHCLNDLLRNGHLNIDRALHAASSYAVDYLTRVREVVRDRAFIEAYPVASTKMEEGQNLVGFGPPNTMNGDVVAILYGLSVPVILRPIRNYSGIQGYRFIGEAYVYGRMDGEIFDTDYEETTFKLV